MDQQSEPSLLVEKLFQNLLHEFQENKIYLFNSCIKLGDLSQFAREIREKYGTLIVIGFGASTLNAKALLSSIAKHKIDIIFIDNVDKAEIDRIFSKVDSKRTAIFAISLSGETDEVICLLEHLELIPQDLFIVAKKDSTLHLMASNSGANYIEYPSQYNVGRCALFNPIFLIIAAIAGVDIDLLFKSGMQALNSAELHAQVIQESTWMLINYHQGRRNIIMISYILSLQGLLEWVNQMLAESLGKEGFGLMPSIYWGTRYEHSSLQLFLDGPDDKMYKIFKNNGGNKLDILLKNHGDAVITKLKETGKPIRTYSVDLNEKTVANLIIKYILVVGLIGKIQNINPFNQPSVEALKILIKKH